MKNYLLPLFCFLIVLSACTSNDNSNKQLRDEVIAIHDEIMPMMGPFVRHSMTIDSIVNNFSEIQMQHPEIDTLQQKEKLIALKNEIEGANDSMNSWMRELNLDFENMSDEEVSAYLQEEKLKITNISKQFKDVETESKEALSLYTK